jgi:hypothetical protein
VSAPVVLRVNGTSLKGVLSPDTGGWNLTSSTIQMGAGDQTISLKNTSNSMVYVDFVSVGTAPLSSLRPQTIAVNTTGPDPEHVTVRLANDPAYILVGISHYPQWKSISARPENDTSYMANGFLTAFYADDNDVELLLV